MQLFIPDDPRPIHFVGIAGAGMSALATIASRRGVTVSGCDNSPRGAADVVGLGIHVSEGHSAEHVREARAVVYTSAIPKDHPELNAAREAGVPVVRRAEALACLVNDGKVVGIAGTHGKTTTTALTAFAFESAGEDPTCIAGGRIKKWKGNARIGSSDLFVVEADEYDQSFLALHPTVAVVNNVEADHLECYGTLADLEAAFVEFSNRAERVLIGSDDSGAARVADRLDAPVWRVGVGAKADLRLSILKKEVDRTTVELTLPDGRKVDMMLSVPGLHNARNAAMAVGAVCALGGDVVAAARGLNDFTGVERRFELLGTAGGYTVVDDYAHHPTEVAATLVAARQRFPGRRIVAVFQPHLYSRTQAHGEALGKVLAAADFVLVTPIYAAREQPIPGVSGEGVAAAARGAGANVEWVEDRSKLTERVLELLEPRDVVITLGAGDITELGPELLQRAIEAVA